MNGDTSGSNVSGEDVQAWIDEELSELEAARVKAAVAVDPELKAIAANIRKQNDLMKSLHASSTQSPKSPLENATDSSVLTAERPRELVRKPFAYAAAILIGFGLGWFGQEWLQRKTVEATWNNEALRVYDFLTDESFWSVDFDAEDLTTFNTVAERLFGRNLPIPDLAEKRFSYYGAKVLPAWDGSSAHLIYRDPDGRLVTISFSSGGNLQQRFRPRVVNFERMRIQTRQIGAFGVSIAAPVEDDTLDYVSAKVFSAFR